jgi:adenine-specific DNA-methyltransferase
MNNFYTYYQLEKMGKKYGAGVLKIQRYDVENLMFIDLDYVSKEDFFKLETLGKKLVDTSDRNLIFEITKIISNYASMSYEKLMSEFGKIKKRRLEA